MILWDIALKMTLKVVGLYAKLSDILKIVKIAASLVWMNLKLSKQSDTWVKNITTGCDRQQTNRGRTRTDLIPNPRRPALERMGCGSLCLCRMPQSHTHCTSNIFCLSHHNLIGSVCRSEAKCRLRPSPLQRAVSRLIRSFCPEVSRHKTCCFLWTVQLEPTRL